MFEYENNLRKTFIILISSLIGLTISLLYFYSEIPINWLSFSELLPGIFVIIFLGWNLIQIHFIKTSFHDLSMKVEKALITDQSNEAIKRTLSTIFLIIGFTIPLLLHSLTIVGFVPSFTTFSGPTPTVEEQTALNIFIAWIIFMYIIIIALGIWQIRIFNKSMINRKPNVFSNMLYIMIWVILWFRSFGFINTFRIVAGQTGSDIFLAIGNVLLLVLTSFMVLRGLAERVKKTDLFSEDSIPFLVYALTIMYVAGQTIMIQGEFGDKNSLDMFNNTILLVSGIIYYLWYSNYILQREGYIQRTLLTKLEVKSIIDELEEKIIKEVPDQSEKVEKQVEEILLKYELKSNINNVDEKEYSLNDDVENNEEQDGLEE
jgi:hypothetical protein